jgi:hypothetical protein
MSTPKSPIRLIQPKKWSLLGTAAATGLSAALGAVSLPAPVAAEGAAPLRASGPAAALPSGRMGEAGEAGEAGEGAVETDDRGVEFLAHLGLFESAIRIVATLYATGHVAEAQAQLEESHHAEYEDLEEGFEDFHQSGFEAEFRAFADSVMAGATAAEVAAAETALLAAIDAAHHADGLDPRDEFETMLHLMETAAADYEGGVTGGKVTEPHEYRDAWGFVETVRARAAELSTSGDAAIAGAASEVLTALEPVLPMFPSLTSATAGDDVSILHGAAGWIRFTILKVE